MVSLRGAIVGFVTGLLLAGGWWVFIDGQLHLQVPFPGLHIIPPLMVTLAAVMIQFVSVTDVKLVAVKVWLFIWLTTLCICIGTAIWMTIRDYPDPTQNYPGVSMIIQTILVSFAALLLFIGRRPLSGHQFDHFAPD